jgi:hypothetical protein
MRTSRDDAGDSVGLAPELPADLRAVAAPLDGLIGTDDAPEVADWSGAVRGRFYKPVGGGIGRIGDCGRGRTLDRKT